MSRHRALAYTALALVICSVHVFAQQPETTNFTYSVVDPSSESALSITHDSLWEIGYWNWVNKMSRSPIQTPFWEGWALEANQTLSSYTAQAGVKFSAAAVDFGTSLSRVSKPFEFTEGWLAPALSGWSLHQANTPAERTNAVFGLFSSLNSSAVVSIDSSLAPSTALVGMAQPAAEYFFLKSGVKNEDILNAENDAYLRPELSPSFGLTNSLYSPYNEYLTQGRDNPYQGFFTSAYQGVKNGILPPLGQFVSSGQAREVADSAASLALDSATGTLDFGKLFQQGRQQAQELAARLGELQQEDTNVTRQLDAAQGQTASLQQRQQAEEAASQRDAFSLIGRRTAASFSAYAPSFSAFANPADDWQSLLNSMSHSFTFLSQTQNQAGKPVPAKGAGPCKGAPDSPTIGGWLDAMVKWSKACDARNNQNKK